jgi:TP901 family phage tail tape measure protein
MALNLTATVNLQLSSGSLRNVQNQLNSGLKSVRADIDVRVNQQGLSQLRGMSQSLSEIQSRVKEVEQGTRRLTGQAGDLGAAMGRAASNAGQLNTQLDAVSRAAQNSISNLGKAENAAEAFGKQAALAGRRFLAFTLAAGSMIKFVGAISEGLSEALKFDREMVRLVQVSNESKSAVGAIADEVTRLSTNLGVSSKELLGTAVIFKQAGLSINETKDALEAMAKAALAPNFDNMKDTAEGAIAIMKQFKVGAKDLEGALGSVNAVAGEFAVEAGDLITAIKQTGGAFAAAAGQTKAPRDALNELLGLFTSVRATTRESAESIATGLRTIFTRIQRQDTINNLKQLNINLRYTADEAKALGNINLTDQFVGAFEAVRRLSEGLSKIPATDQRFSAILEDLGGYRQISKVIPLIQQFADAQKAVNIAQAGSTSLAANASQAQEAYTVKIQKLKEEFLSLVRGVASTSSFKTFIDVLLGGASAAVKLLDALKPLLPVITALATVKIASNLFSFTRGFADGATTNKTAPRLAKGGLVPGVGNTDSVSMDLPVGSYVVRKDAVKAIGAGRLASMGKYASGGKVTPAMVMPGEYIYSPDEARSIGTSTLNKMNGAGKYAGGGYVRHFADGGENGPGGDKTVSLREFRLLNSNDLKAAQDKLKSAILAQVQQVFADKNASDQLQIAKNLLTKSVNDANEAQRAANLSLRQGRASEALGSRAARFGRQAEADDTEAGLKRKSAGEIRSSGSAALADELKKIEQEFSEARSRATALRTSADEIRKASLDAEKSGHFTEAGILKNLSSQHTTKAQNVEANAVNIRDVDSLAAQSRAKITADLANKQDQEADQAAKRAERRRQAAEKAQEQSNRFKDASGANKDRSIELDAKSAVRVGRDFLGNQTVTGTAAGDLVNNRATGVGRNTLKGLAQELSEKDANRLGGSISNATKQALTDARMEQIKNQYISTVTRQIQVLNSTLTSDEARKLATERYTQALERNNVQLLRNRRRRGSW